MVHSGWLQLGFCVVAAAKLPPETFMWDGAALQSTRQIINGGTPPQTVLAALEALKKDASAVATEGPWSVMQKPLTPASGDKHDYMSVGSYWWPCTELCNTTIFPNPGECLKWNESDLGPKGPPYKICNKTTGFPWYVRGLAHRINSVFSLIIF